MRLAQIQQDFLTYQIQLAQVRALSVLALYLLVEKKLCFPLGRYPNGYLFYLIENEGP